MYLYINKMLYGCHRVNSPPETTYEGPFLLTLEKMALLRLLTLFSYTVVLSFLSQKVNNTAYMFLD